MISAAIVAYNEATKLSVCLASIADFVDEIVVVDLGSTDNLQKIAAKYKAKIVPHAHVSHVELVRNFSIAQCKGDWILILDPDEKLPVSLKRYLLKYVGNHSRGALNIPRMNIFFGEWIRHTNFWPDYQIRFFSRGMVKWQEVLHSYPTTKLPATKVPLDTKLAIRHTTYPTFASFLQKQDRYSTIRAQEKQAAGETFSVLSLAYSTSREFLSRYIKHYGFLDKKVGALLMLGLLYYHWGVEWKLKLLKRTPPTG